MLQAELLNEAERQLSICNACRYCEGYCAVFPAMERRRAFTSGDITYLANLCHDCRACYYACMFTPPHEFAVNLPAVLSQTRVDVYRHYAWPQVLSRLVQTRALWLVLSISVLVVLVLVAAASGPANLFALHLGPGAFYEIVPYLAMVLPALAISAYVVVALVAGAINFCRDTHGSWTDLLDLRALWGATAEALSLRWLRGGGEGCYYPEDRGSYSRLVYHSLVFYGFLAALLSTTLAAIYQDFLDLLPPYPVMSLPVMFGIVGGVGMIIGTAGLIYLKWKSSKASASEEMVGLDYAFLIVLGLVSVTGMLTLVFRSTRLMGLMLTIHLGTLVALYVTVPYSKFVHFVYRYAALVQNKVEERRETAGGQALPDRVLPQRWRGGLLK